ncbi:hypothetical protein ACFOWE_16360 [Planomonospora corallina]|uniref:Septum formation initiator n=1 Tax=Planomonospora corallina TaxID=1806052 RepID=A0ABV8I938_9ACTN
MVGLLCGGLVTLLVLNTVLAQNSLRESELRAGIKQLLLEKEKLKNENMRRETPGELARAADLQGMLSDDSARVIVPGGSADSRVASEDQTPVGRERVPGTGR